MLLYPEVALRTVFLIRLRVRSGISRLDDGGRYLRNTESASGALFCLWGRCKGRAER
jgi:hypothetical protein